MAKPHALRPGDTVSMVSPASPLAPALAAKGIDVLEKAGFKVKLYPNTFHFDGYLSGTDEMRAKALTRAFDDPDTQAVYCSRGGYGCSRLMPFLDFDHLAKSRKQLIGFSDITVLHAALNRRGLPTVHGPMALTLNTDREPWVYESLINCMKGENPIHPDAPNGKTLIQGTAEGTVVGGCMILMCDLIGTPEQIDLTDKIVLIEDVDEPSHRIDAMLTHLINSGSIQKAAGLVIGEMTRSDERADLGIGFKPWREIVRDRVEPLGIPTIIDYPFGHARQMLTLPLGIRARMDSSAGTLEYTENLCE